MTKIIPNSFPNARCKSCDKRFVVGEHVRWTKGGGAVCVTCPTQATQPQAEAAPEAQTQAQVIAALQASVEALANRAKNQDAEIRLLRRTLDEIRATFARPTVTSDDGRCSCITAAPVAEIHGEESGSVENTDDTCGL